MRSPPARFIYFSWALTALLLLGAALLWITGEPVVDVAERVQGWGLLGMLLFGALFALTALLLLPGAPLIFLAGMVYGPWLGFVVASTAATVAAGIAFSLAGSVAGGWLQTKAHQHRLVRALLHTARSQGFILVLLARLSPLVPFAALNVAMGATGLRLSTFLLASWLGKSPSIFAIVYVAQAARPEDSFDRSALSDGLFLLGIMATVYGSWRVIRTARQHLETAP